MPYIKLSYRPNQPNRWKIKKNKHDSTRNTTRNQRIQLCRVSKYQIEQLKALSASQYAQSNLSWSSQNSLHSPNGTIEATDTDVIDIFPDISILEALPQLLSHSSAGFSLDEGDMAHDNDSKDCGNIEYTPYDDDNDDGDNIINRSPSDHHTHNSIQSQHDDSDNPIHISPISQVRPLPHSNSVGVSLSSPKTPSSIARIATGILSDYICTDDDSENDADCQDLGRLSGQHYYPSSTSSSTSDAYDVSRSDDDDDDATLRLTSSSLHDLRPRKAITAPTTPYTTVQPSTPRPIQQGGHCNPASVNNSIRQHNQQQHRHHTRTTTHRHNINNHHSGSSSSHLATPILMPTLSVASLSHCFSSSSISPGPVGRSIMAAQPPVGVAQTPTTYDVLSSAGSTPISTTSDHTLSSSAPPPPPLELGTPPQQPRPSIPSTPISIMSNKRQKIILQVDDEFIQAYTRTIATNQNQNNNSTSTSSLSTSSRRHQRTSSQSNIQSNTSIHHAPRYTPTSVQSATSTLATSNHTVHHPYGNCHTTPTPRNNTTNTPPSTSMTHSSLPFTPCAPKITSSSSQIRSTPSSSLSTLLHNTTVISSSSHGGGSGSNPLHIMQRSPTSVHPSGVPLPTPRRQAASQQSVLYDALSHSSGSSFAPSDHDISLILPGTSHPLGHRHPHRPHHHHHNDHNNKPLGIPSIHSTPSQGTYSTETGTVYIARPNSSYNNDVIIDHTTTNINNLNNRDIQKQQHSHLPHNMNTTVSDSPILSRTVSYMSIDSWVDVTTPQHQPDGTRSSPRLRQQQHHDITSINNDKNDNTSSLLFDISSATHHYGHDDSNNNNNNKTNGGHHVKMVSLENNQSSTDATVLPQSSVHVSMSSSTQSHLLDSNSSIQSSLQQSLIIPTTTLIDRGDDGVPYTSDHDNSIYINDINISSPLATPIDSDITPQTPLSRSSTALPTPLLSKASSAMSDTTHRGYKVSSSHHDSQHSSLDAMINTPTATDNASNDNCHDMAIAIEESCHPNHDTIADILVDAVNNDIMPDIHHTILSPERDDDDDQETIQQHTNTTTIVPSLDVTTSYDIPTQYEHEQIQQTPQVACFSLNTINDLLRYVHPGSVVIFDIDDTLITLSTQYAQFSFFLHSRGADILSACVSGPALSMTSQDQAIRYLAENTFHVPSAVIDPILSSNGSSSSSLSSSPSSTQQQQNRLPVSIHNMIMIQRIYNRIKQMNYTDRTTLLQQYSRIKHTQSTTENELATTLHTFFMNNNITCICLTARDYSLQHNTQQILDHTGLGDVIRQFSPPSLYGPTQQQQNNNNNNNNNKYNNKKKYNNKHNNNNNNRSPYHHHNTPSSRDKHPQRYTFSISNNNNNTNNMDTFKNDNYDGDDIYHSITYYYQNGVIYAENQSKGFIIYDLIYRGVFLDNDDNNNDDHINTKNMEITPESGPSSTASSSSSSFSASQQQQQSTSQMPIVSPECIPSISGKQRQVWMLDDQLAIIAQINEAFSLLHPHDSKQISPSMHNNQLLRASPVTTATTSASASVPPTSSLPPRLLYRSTTHHTPHNYLHTVPLLVCCHYVNVATQKKAIHSKLDATWPITPSAVSLPPGASPAPQGTYPFHPSYLFDLDSIILYQLLYYCESPSNLTLNDDYLLSVLFTKMHYSYNLINIIEDTTIQYTQQHIITLYNTILKFINELLQG